MSLISIRFHPRSIIDRLDRRGHRRRESVLGPHVGAGIGGQIGLTADLDHNRSEVIIALELLLQDAKQKNLDHLLKLTAEEIDIVRGRPLAA